MAASDEILQIDTPENVMFGYEIAGIGSRFLAALIDTMIIAVILFVVILTGVAVINTTGMIDNIERDQLGTWLAAIFSLLLFIILWGYYIAFEFIWNGQTPGKRAIKLRVIRRTGTPVTLAEVLIRNLVRLIDFLPISYGVGVVAMFISSQSQRLGDLAAGTLVVWDHSEVSLETLRERKPVSSVANRPAPPVSVDAEPTQQPEPSVYPVERLTQEDVHMMEEFMRRRFEIANSRAMALQIVRVIRERLEVPTDQVLGQQPEKWLAEVLAAYHAHRQ